jgi:hypothetical protein
MGLNINQYYYSSTSCFYACFSFWETLTHYEVNPYHVLSEAEVSLRLTFWGCQQDVDGAFVLPAGSLRSEKRNHRMVKGSQRVENHSYVNQSFWLRPKAVLG